MLESSELQVALQFAAVGADGEPPDAGEVDAVSSLSAQAGARIGMLRTMARTSLQASTDSLTGLMNRRTFQSRIRAMRRTGVPFSLVMADLDHFKRLNDTYGHEMGDRALTTFCQVSKTVLRQEDMMARWGGEEFAFALAGVDVHSARIGGDAGTAVDRFSLSDPQGHKLDNAAMGRIRRALEGERGRASRRVLR